jgi:hypothetical protein
MVHSWLGNWHRTTTLTGYCFPRLDCAFSCPENCVLGCRFNHSVARRSNLKAENTYAGLCLVGYRSGRARTDIFLIRFDPVRRYLALGSLEIQLAGAYELVEFPLEAHLSHTSSRAPFWLIGAKGYELNWILPTIAESSDQPRSRRSCTA